MVQAKTLLILILILLPASCNEAPRALGPGQEDVRDNEDHLAREMTKLIKATSEKRYPDTEVKRFNQAKSLGCFRADFFIDQGLPSHLQKGLFAEPGHYPAQIRFANASTQDDHEKDLRGMSVKVLSVKGQSLWGEDGTQDFTLNSHPALFAATPEDFLQFIRATHRGRVWWYFINPMDPHLKSLWILFQARQQHTSPFHIPYWSTTPYRFGEDNSVAVKYSAKPCSDVEGRLPESPHADYLREAMQQDLRTKPVCFEFMVQFQKDPQAMPIEDASVVWDESVSPFQKVATITIDDQAFLTDQSLSECERLSFNPWQSLSAHRPLGGMNRVRKLIYAELAEFRNTKNESRRMASRE